MKRISVQKRIIFAVIFTIVMLINCSGITLHAATWDNLETIVVGVPTDRCPMLYENQNSNITGIGVDLLRLAAADAGYNIIFKPIGDMTLKQALDDEEFDLVMPLGSAIKSEQGKSSITSEALLQTPMTLLTLNNKELPELKNTKVGMLSSQAGIVESIRNLYLGLEIVLFDNLEDAVDALYKNKVDALLNNSYVWSYVLQKPAYSKLYIHPTVMITMDFRAGTLDTPEKHEMIERLNRSIRRLTASQKQAIILEHTTKKLYKYNVYDYLYQYSIFFISLVIITLLVLLYVRQLRRAKKIAEEASKAKSDFLASMSHEIRTPINVIMGIGELISREATDTKMKQYAYSINSSANSLLCLINDVLDFSKMEAGKLKIRSDQYSLSNLISDVEIMIKSRAESKGLAYLMNVNEDTPDELIGDEIRIKQVLINLLTNSVKYTKEGTVTLSIDYEKDGNEEVILHISVKDTGIGMKQEEISKLFVAFERLDEDKNKTIEGTGLGMSIVKHILDAMESTLEVESVYGEGSEFKFAIKQRVFNWKRIGSVDSEERKLKITDNKYTPVFFAPDVRLLSVDDTEMNLKVIEGLLEPTKIHIDSVLSAKAALKNMKEIKYDILLIDHRMPEMDGIELIKKIRKDNSNINRESVCIALTANVVEGARDMYIKAGFDDYMEKPVKVRKLEEMLIKHLPKDKVLMADKYIIFSPNKH